MTATHLSFMTAHGVKMLTKATDHQYEFRCQRTRSICLKYMLQLVTQTHIPLIGGVHIQQNDCLCVWMATKV